MSKREECTALIASSNECRNGFPVTSPCHGICAGVAPICMKEVVCARLYDQWGGTPPVVASALGKEQQP